MTELSHLEVAAEQLNWAIRLFLDAKAVVPAITLAGAAEEIIGKHVVNGKNAFDSVRAALSAKGYGEADQIGRTMNRLRNNLKHRTNQKSISLEFGEEEAIQLITRAMINLIIVARQNNPDKISTIEGPRFYQWVVENRPDLFK